MDMNGLIQHGIVGLSANTANSEDFLVFINDTVSCEDVEAFTIGYGCDSISYLREERITSLNNVWNEKDKHLHCLKQECHYYCEVGENNHPSCSTTKISECMSLDYVDSTHYEIRELNNIIVKRKSIDNSF